MHFWKCFSAFDPQGLPENISKIAGCRNGELEILIIHYGKTKKDTFKSITNYVEWQGFKRFITTVLMSLEKYNCIRPLTLFSAKRTRFLGHKSSSDSCYLTLLSLKNISQKLGLFY